jgi:hypothetical protein
MMGGGVGLEIFGAGVSGCLSWREDGLLRLALLR